MYTLQTNYLFLFGLFLNSVKVAENDDLLDDFVNFFVPKPRTDPEQEKRKETGRSDSDELLKSWLGYPEQKRREDCPIGRYSVNCLKECHCRVGPCDAVTGACSNGVCQDGWKGIACNEINAIAKEAKEAKEDTMPLSKILVISISTTCGVGLLIICLTVARVCIGRKKSTKNTRRRSQKAVQENKPKPSDSQQECNENNGDHYDVLPDVVLDDGIVPYKVISNDITKRMAKPMQTEFQMTATHLYTDLCLRQSNITSPAPSYVFGRTTERETSVETNFAVVEELYDDAMSKTKNTATDERLNVAKGKATTAEAGKLFHYGKGEANLKVETNNTDAKLQENADKGETYNADFELLENYSEDEKHKEFDNKEYYFVDKQENKSRPSDSPQGECLISSDSPQDFNENNGAHYEVMPDVVNDDSILLYEVIRNDVTESKVSPMYTSFQESSIMSPAPLYVLGQTTERETSNETHFNVVGELYDDAMSETKNTAADECVNVA